MRPAVPRLALMLTVLAGPLVGQGGSRPHLTPVAPSADPRRPLGTQREWAGLQQEWLRLRLERTLPMLMRRDSVDMWIVPMREYNEDPVFSSIVSPTTFSARRRTIYVFFDRGGDQGVERLALGGTSQGGLYTAVRSELAATNVSSGRTTAELWGSAQWDVLTKVIRDRKPRKIALDIDTTFAFADGLTLGEYTGMLSREVLKPQGEWKAQILPAGRLAVDMIAVRQREEEATFERMNRLTWDIIEEAFSSRVITPGVTRTSDVVWWMRQRVADLGLTTWFQPSVDVQRKGGSDAVLGDDPVIQKGDVLHCDFGITALRLNTDTQHMGYVLRDGERDVPPGLQQALRTANRLQDIVTTEIRSGRTGNEVLRSSRELMAADSITGTIYSHPIGMHGHGAGPLIGLWDYQDGVPGRGDHQFVPSTWYSIELQATSPVAEWGGQPVRVGQEEDVILDGAGAVRWGYQRQVRFHLVRPVTRGR
ncbi:MAG: aminopeptidase P family protein [Gemmatimonadaceae bacterium]|nr:aminopeptidase P family protein [Gemmatimonadaceae bacterium]